MAASYRWNIMRCIGMLFRALALFQILQITMVSSEGLPRGRRTPGWSIRDDPEVINRTMIVKRDGTPPAETTPPAAWPKQVMAIDQVSCSSKASYLANAMDTVQNMLQAGKSGIGIIRSNFGTERSGWADDARVKLDMFMSMYGLFDPANTEETTLARERLQSVEEFLDQMLTGFTQDTIPLTIFCNDDHLVLDHTKPRKLPNGQPDKKPDEIYKSNTILTMVPTEFTGKCAAMPDLWAQMDVTDPLTQDVMTICAHSWLKWDDRHLVDWAAKSLPDIKSQSLDSILNASPELTLLHELTHAEAFFGAEGVKEDMTIKGRTAYEFKNCYKLGRKYEEESDMAQNKALMNAETFAYFCAGMYLDKCNWRNGECKDPAQVK